MAVSTLKGGTKTNSAFKYTLYKRLQTIVRTEIACFPQGKFNHFHIVIAFAMAISFFSCNDFTGDMKFKQNRTTFHDTFILHPYLRKS